MTAYCQVYGVIHFTSPAGWLPVHRDQLRAQRSVTSMGKLYLYLYLRNTKKCDISATVRSIDLHKIKRDNAERVAEVIGC